MVPSEKPETETREQGVEFGELEAKLRSHEYPTTQKELLQEYGDYELELSDGSKTLQEILEGGENTNDDVGDKQYDSLEEVHQSVLNMVGDEAVGRRNYSDRGGSLEGQGIDREKGDETL
ncbi:DUF5789 family protein [Haloarcula nitratireducens]|uniref:DUF2795 domain-containing protein n=1 Tax=Haloarcula nitratireducens TaxID=2487749 RepID=A0AAW4PHK7_9EURY|nr:hypothetical protein [Halomicroarcula nitratireducens]MBX0296750.1 hypothetical protein [Halomicroarcula nitratireducens]